MSLTAQGGQGVSYLFSFPFWIFINTDFVLGTKAVVVDGLRVRVYPPFRSGAPNFTSMPAIDPERIPFLPGTAPHMEADYRIPLLATMPNFDTDPTTSLRLVWGEDWQNSPPRILPTDSLRIDVLVREEAADLPERVVAGLLEGLRWRSRQWWIQRSSDGLAGQLRSTFSISTEGSPIEQPDKRSRGRTARGDERPIDSALWDETIDSLQIGLRPPAYSLLLLDGRYFGATADIRRSILDTASACEIAKDLTYERLWQARRPRHRFRRSKVIRAYELPNHVGEDMDRFIGRSYERENPNEFQAIKELWDARNAVAHGNRSRIEQLADQQTPFRVMEPFTAAAEHCVRWLEAL